jgi:hypothetical protein
METACGQLVRGVFADVEKWQATGGLLLLSPQYGDLGSSQLRWGQSRSAIVAVNH